jgi:Ca2+-binding RTX toxin-like protein
MADSIFTLTSTNPFGLNDVGSLASPVFVDIDGDKDLDAFVGNDDGNTLFFKNSGTINSPTFVAPISNPFGLSDVGSLASPAFVDIDGDGDLDAFVGNGGRGYDVYISDGGDTLYFKNIGSSSNPIFAAAITNPFGLSNVKWGANPTFADIDGDGDMDALIGSGYYGGDTTFFRNTGTATNPLFASAPSFGLIGVGYYASPTFVDIDDDKDLDALLGAGSGNIVFQRNTGTISNPVFAAASYNPLDLVDVGSGADPTFVDIDGDGDLDAFVGNGDTPFFRNIGTANNPNFAAPVTNPFGLSNVQGTSPTFVDIDDDGDKDAFVGNNDGNTIFFRNTGTTSNPAFATPETNPYGLSNVGRSGVNPIIFADIDSDGDSDAFVNSSFFENKGTASSPVFAAPIYSPFGLDAIAGSEYNLTLADIDGDGDLDAFVEYHYNGYNVYNGYGFFKNIGTASSPEFAPIRDSFGFNDAGYNAPTFADIDGDGDLDAFGGNWNGNTLFFENTGTINNPLFAAASNPLGFSNVGKHAVPAFADIDSDGDLDAFIGNSAGNTQFFVNNGLLLASKPGNDTLTGTPSNNDTATYASATAAVTVSLNLSTQQNTIGAGLDTITKIENLIGSVFADNLTGNSANNILEGKGGNDTLRGWSGADMMIGGLGNDTYFVENVGDVVTEKLNEGTDTVSSRLTYTLPANVENLILTGTGTINGTGNSQSNIIHGNNAANQLNGGDGNDTLNGGAGDDTLTGWSGADTMIGGLGNDTYFVENVGDVVTEKFNEGTDTVSSRLTYTLPANVENLTLTGTSTVNGTGNGQANVIIGNNVSNQLSGGVGNDTLDGGLGANKLTGGSGNDNFKFTTKGHIDTITDYNVLNDTIQLENAVFTALTATGILAASQFKIGTKALDANDFIIYNKTAGALLYDADGNGAGAAVQIATIGAGLNMTNADIVVI